MSGRAKAWRLLAAFGIYGIVVWPALAWLGYDLIATELFRLHGLHVAPSTLIGRDFVNIWHGGREALDGAAGVYDREAYRRSLADAAGVHGIYAFSYPPHMLLLAIPFGLPPYLWSLALWTVGGFALFAHAARPWLRDAGLPGWAVLLLPGAIVNLWAGHFGFLIGALALYGWRWAGDRPRRAGAAFALMSVKPHLGVLVPVILALRRDWRTMLWAGAGVLLLVAASAAMFGLSAWATWIGSTLRFQAGLIEPATQPEYIFMMPSPTRMMAALSPDAAVTGAGAVLFAVAAAGLLICAAMRGASIAALGLLSFAATPLMLPYIFNYDLVGLSLAALLWASGSPGPWWSAERLAYGAAFVVPLAQAPLAHEGMWLSPVALLAALGFAAWRAGEGKAGYR